MSILDRLATRVRAERRARGTLGALRWLAAILWARLVYRRRAEMRIECDLQALRSFPPRGDLEIREATPADREVLERFALRHADAKDAAKLRTYLANGYGGHVAHRGGELVGYSWWVDARVSSEKTHPALCRLGIAPAAGEVVTFDVFLAPDQRGGGRSQAFFGQVLTALRERGFRTARGWVDADNLPARVLHRAIGWKDRGVVRSRLLLGRILVCEGRIYVANGRRSAIPFDFHPLG